MTTEATLLTIIKDGRILLQRKASGRFGEGKWNGVGGKIRPGETPEECAGRETLEETGLHVAKLRHHGEVVCYFGHDTPPVWVVHIFSTSDFKGSLKESSEGVLKWFPLSEISYDEMWQDDRYWLLLLLKGKRFRGEFIYNDEGTQLLDASLETE